MPTVTTRLIKAAWLWFAVGLILGGIMSLAKADWITTRALGLRSTHLHILAIGWGAQWVFGIAFWIYPAWGAERTAPRFTRVMHVCWALLNLGTLVRAIGEGTVDLAFNVDGMRTVFAIGAMAQLVAGLVFVGVIWRRIRPRRWIREQMVRARAQRAAENRGNDESSGG